MQCAKKTLKSLLQNRIFGKDALRNALVEAEGVLNSRRITHVSNDAGDIETLTLNHFPCNEEAEVSEREINATNQPRGIWPSGRIVSTPAWTR